MKLLVRCTLAGLSLLVAQIVAGQPRLAHGIAGRGEDFSSFASSATVDTVDILAVLAQFKKDNSPRTSGDGTFDLSNPPHRRIDPPPYDASFFRDKLLFVSNYFSSVSNGKVTIRWHILDSLVSLPNEMAMYAPPKDGSDDARMVSLIEDVWKQADAKQQGFDFSQYDLFVIFHAGAGRDIDLISILGYDPTPDDIPTLFVSLPAMRRYKNDPSYSGVSVNSGSFRITNSLIFPSTLTRVFDGLSGPDTLQLSTNGLLAASIGSYLGLPDLFDTKTGRSGIGQFGLMDGAGIFAYSGLFPPEPSAWEKIRLGWLEPIVVKSDSEQIVLPAVGLTESGVDSVYRINITNDEYYLLENRSRDPFQNGQRLTIRRNGVDRSLHFDRDTSRFNFEDQSLIDGSVIYAEDYDWALPGSALSDPAFRGGGILIWHIDERIVRENLESNTINADIKRKGVRLIEADGAEDIGRYYEFLTPGDGTQNGYPLDAWFVSNSSPVYKNRFDESTLPPAVASNGSPSLISLSRFTDIAPRMSVQFKYSSTAIDMIAGLNKSLGAATASPRVSSVGDIIALASGSRLILLRSDGTSPLPNGSGILDSLNQFSDIAISRIEPDTLFVAVTSDSSVVFWKLTSQTTAGVFQQVTRYGISLGETATTKPLMYRKSGAHIVAVGTHSGRLVEVTSSGAIFRNRVISSTPIRSLTAIDTTLFCSAGGLIFSTAGTERTLSASDDWIVASAVSYAPTMTAVLFAMDTLNGELVALAPDLSITYWRRRLDERGILSFAIADVNADGFKDVLVRGRKLYAYNPDGFLVEGYPVSPQGADSFVGSPLVADVDGDGLPDIGIIDNIGRYTVFPGARTASVLRRFSVSSSSVSSSTFFLTRDGSLGMLVSDSDGWIKGVDLRRPNPTVWWRQEGGSGDLLYHSFSAPFAVRLPKGLMPMSEVYNYPNPVYYGATFIRYRTEQDAEITITITDLAGLKVAELRGRSVAGIAGEIEWNVKDIASGIYFGKVEARSSGGHEAVTIKIAVVK